MTALVGLLRCGDVCLGSNPVLRVFPLHVRSGTLSGIAGRTVRCRSRADNRHRACRRCGLCEVSTRRGPPESRCLPTPLQGPAQAIRWRDRPLPILDWRSHVDAR